MFKGKMSESEFKWDFSNLMKMKLYLSYFLTIALQVFNLVILI